MHSDVDGKIWMTIQAKLECFFFFKDMSHEDAVGVHEWNLCSNRPYFVLITYRSCFSDALHTWDSLMPLKRRISYVRVCELQPCLQLSKEARLLCKQTNPVWVIKPWFSFYLQ